jgi:type IV secretion system protein VirD4
VTAANGSPPGHHGQGEVVALAVVGVALSVAGWVWASGQLAAWLAGHGWMAVPITEAPAVAVQLPAHLSDPRTAWPVAVRAGLPGPVGLAACGAALLAVVALAAGGGWKLYRYRLHPAGGPAIASRPGRTGARWATAADVRTLRAGPAPGRLRGRRSVAAAGPRLTLGYRSDGGGTRLGRPGRGRLICTESRHSVLVIGPTQSGKTTGLAIPALLEWPGPVIATSVKDDLASATLGWRSRQGPCWVFDPTMTSGLRPIAAWTPLGACEDWSSAQRVAGWLVEATPARSGMADAAFWYSAAAKQLAPLLLAARRGGLEMGDVVRWTNTADFDQPAGFLQMAGESEAAVALAACEMRDGRIQSSVSTTLETVLAPFEDPVVASATRWAEIDLDRLLDQRGSLFLCGPAHEQHRVQGLFAALVSSVVATAVGRVNSSGRALDPPLLLVLDEAANIAPIRDLDALASTGAGMGVQLVTVCQDLSQLGTRYGVERARTIANNHRAKVLLSGVSDLATLDLMSGLAGEAVVREQSMTHDLRDGRRTRSTAVAFRRLAPTDELRRIPPGSGVLVYGHLPPVRLRLRPWYGDRRLRERAEAGAAHGAGDGPTGGVGDDPTGVSDPPSLASGGA